MMIFKMNKSIKNERRGGGGGGGGKREHMLIFFMKFRTKMILWFELDLNLNKQWFEHFWLTVNTAPVASHWLSDSRETACRTFIVTPFLPHLY